MSVLAVRTEDKPEVRQWFNETRARSKTDRFIKWKMKVIKSGKDLLLVFEFKPVIFNFTIFGWVMAFGVFFVWGLNWVVWAGVVIGMGTYFWTPEFCHHMTILALRKKAKYRGSIKRVKLSELIQEVVL